jgi:hypothetical protein
MISSSAASTHSRHYEPHAPHVHAARGQRSSSCVDMDLHRVQYRDADLRLDASSATQMTST